jgi:hypothetical protein
MPHIPSVSQVNLRHEDDLWEPAACKNACTCDGPPLSKTCLSKTFTLFNSGTCSKILQKCRSDLTEFYMSVEWDVLEVPALRNVKFYTCCQEPYLDITFNISM